MELPVPSGVDHARIRQAYIASRQGYSADRVIADKELSEEFVKHCRSRGLADSDEDLKWALFNARKSGSLADCGPTVPTSFENEDEYRFAAEIAGRFLERRDGATIDRILCSTGQAGEFDDLAIVLCPGYSSLEYRWAILNLRKTRSLAPEVMSQIAPSISVTIKRVSEINIDEISNGQGLYMFLDSATQDALYVGESRNLRRRVTKHLEHSDNRGLAHWLWERGTDDIWFELHELPANTTMKARRALERELIDSREPILNIRV